MSDRMTPTEPGMPGREPLLDWQPPPEGGGPRRLWPLVAVLVFVLATVAGAVVLQVGGAGRTAPEPVGTAAVRPPIPPGRTLYLAPLDGTPTDRVDRLAAYFARRYGIDARTLPATATPGYAWDEARGQLIAEAVLQSLPNAYPDRAVDRGAVVIAITDRHLYIQGRPDWAWAFGLRSDDLRWAVVSTFAMELGEPDPARVETRLRRMVGKNVGLMYFGLEASDDPRSLVYRSIVSVGDLDAMGDEF